jgi:hypothetical protein
VVARQNLRFSPEEEKKCINEGSRVMPDIDLLRDQIYRPPSEESIITMETMFYSGSTDL